MSSKDIAACVCVWAIAAIALFGSSCRKTGPEVSAGDVPTTAPAAPQVQTAPPAPATKQTPPPASPGTVTVEYDTNTGKLTATGPIDMKINKREETTTTGATSKRVDTGAAAGSGASAIGQETKLEHRTDPPALTFGATGPGGAGGATAGQAGGADTSGEAKGLNQGAMMFYATAALMLVAGILVGGWLGRWKMGGVLILGSFVCAYVGWSIESNPYALLVIPAVVAVLAGCYVWETHGRVQSETALEVVTAGVEDYAKTNPASGRVVKDGILKRAGDKVTRIRAAVRKAKQRAGVA